MISTGKIDAVGRTYRHAKRYSAILNVLVKYGFGDLVDALNIREHIEIVKNRISRQQPDSIENLSRPERVRMVLEELGPTFVKLGQILSTRADHIPLEYVEELSKLRDADHRSGRLVHCGRYGVVALDTFLQTRNEVEK